MRKVQCECYCSGSDIIIEACHTRAVYQTLYIYARRERVAQMTLHEREDYLCGLHARAAHTPSHIHTPKTAHYIRMHRITC